MKKTGIFLLVIFLMQGVAAISLDIEKEIINDVVITEFENPAIFNLKIKNNGDGDTFRIFNLHGVTMLPEEEFFIGAGQTKEIDLIIYPRKDLDYGRFFQKYSFNYHIQDSKENEMRDTALIRISKLRDAFEITSKDIEPESEEITITFSNNINYDFGDVSVRFSSGFFNSEENFYLGENEKKNFIIKIDKEKYRQLTAGFYTIKAEIFVENISAIVEGSVRFSEKSLVSESEESSGFIIRTRIIETKNNGNSVVISENQVKKNIISRLFTSFEPEPDFTERKGLSVNYYWNRNVRPGETFRITVKTNWAFPFLFIFLVLIIFVFLKFFSKKEITLKKKINFIRAKGGEFALKVSIQVHANKYVERVSVIDAIPPLVKVYERYGGEKPSRIDEKKRRIDWDFEKLESGEIKMLSYIIYSKVGIMGKFELPVATAIYEREGKIKETKSNKTFFVAEQRKKGVEE